MNPTQRPKGTQSARFSQGMTTISCAMAIKATVFFLAALLFFASGACARPTTEDEARNVAANWRSLESKPMGSSIGHQVKSVETFTDEAGDPAYYVVHLLPSGLIFLPADDQVEPVIGFVSDATSYDPSPANPLGALVSRDIPGRVAYVREKEAALQSGATPAADSPMAKAQNKWARLSGTAGIGDGLGPASSSPPDTLPSVSDVRVDKLVQSQWGQACADTSNGNNNGNPPCNSGDPDVFNYYTPPNAQGDPNNYLSGCTATAMAQVMKYFRYPSASFVVKTSWYYVAGIQYPGSFRGGDGSGGFYLWDDIHMPLITSGGTTPAQQQAIGSLTWDAGIALHSTYTPGETSAPWGGPANAFVTYFQYSNAIHGNNNYNWTGSLQPDDPLYAMINANLHARYPVLLGIQTSDNPPQGHEVVCDGYGYNASTMYHHLNMGWYNEDNVWYNLPTIHPVQNAYQFNTIYECTYNIYASGYGEIIAGRVTDSLGDPISGAQVVRQGSDGSQYSTVTNANGIYAFTFVPSGISYTISAAKNGYSFPTTLSARIIASISGTATTGNLWQEDFVGYVQTGSLTVTITPAAAVSAGAMWSVNAGASWNASGVPVSLAAGNYTVNFKTIAGWTSPGNQTATIVSGQPTSLTGAYIPPQPGTLTVTITPAAAVSAGAMWSVNAGASWNASGVPVSLAAGSYTVSYKTISGWTSPGNQSATIVSAQPTSLTGAYIPPQPGTLTVTITPAAAVSAGAMWSVNAGASWNASGVPVSLAAGNYTVNFKTIAGWTSPGNQTATIVSGQPTSLTGAYIPPQPGTLTVTITPAAAVSAGAMWSVNAGASWNASGVPVSLAAGSYTVSYKTISGWTSPGNQSATIVSAQPTSLTGAYIPPQPGTLTVTITPAAAVSAGAMWSYDGGGTWQASGAVVSLAAGSYTVSYKTISGWTSPGNQSATIVSAQPTSLTGAYIPPQPGTLTVTITPAAAVSAGAMWSYDGGGTWQASGAVVSLAAGSYTVSYKTISGWTSPGNQSATIVSAQPTSLTGAYIPPQPGTLTVTITPAAAVSAGAMWSYDGGGTWQASGAVVSLAAGSYTVSYKTISGWTSPGNQSATIVSAQPTSLTGAYIPPQPGTLTVTITPAAAVSAGAMWSCDGGAWQASGATVGNLSLGLHGVYFNGIAGWIGPTSQTLNIVSGQNTWTGTYVQPQPHTGWLAVSIIPAAAISAGAMWRVDGGTWQNSGTPVNLVAGPHTASFNTIAGWTSPASQTVNIVNGEGLGLIGTYVQHPQTGGLAHGNDQPGCGG